MAQRKILLEVSYHYDNGTGIHKVGEIDFGIHGELKGYLEKYGFEGKNEIMATIAYLGFAVQDEYNRLRRNNAQSQQEN